MINGKLEAFFETGTEGVIWSVYDDDDNGYNSLHCLKDGDYLEVFNEVGSILWKGKINLEYKTRYRPYPLNPQYGQQEVLGYWVRGLQKDTDSEVWAKMFFEAKRAKLIPVKNE